MRFINELLVISLAFILLFLGQGIIKSKMPSIDDYYEEGLSPEEVIRKYYDGYNIRDENKVRSTLTDGKEDNVLILIDRSKKYEILSIDEDAKEKESYIKYGMGLEENRYNIKCYTVVCKEININDNSESKKLYKGFSLVKNIEGIWLIDDCGEA